MIAGIDARAAAEEPAGRGRYVRELLRALSDGDDRHRFLLYARERWDGPLDERFEWRLLGSRDPRWHRQAARLANRECDAFLSTNSYLTPWFLHVPTVVVVHDLVAFDSRFRPPRRSAWIERATIGRGLRRAAGVTCVSQATADDLARRHPGVVDRITVTRLGVSPLPSTDSGDDLPDGFVLAVGTLEPRKNLPRLAEAYGSLPAELRASHPLLVAGPTGWDGEETERALAALGDDVRLLGRVSDARLGALYRRCTVFAYPSLAEGFGLPVLEAMAEGAAVLTSNRSSLPEVGGDAAEYADPESVADIASKLEGLLCRPDRRAELGTRARERAAMFSWHATAAGALAALERVAR